MARSIAMAAFLLAVAGTSIVLAAHAAGRVLDETTRESFVSSAPSPIASAAGQELYVLGDRGLDERAYLSADSNESCAFGKVGDYDGRSPDFTIFQFERLRWLKSPAIVRSESRCSVARETRNVPSAGR
nr:unnamed protein product [Digitaria exilis]